MADAIALDGVSKVFPGGNWALEDVSLSVDPGTFLVLLGPSGSGKTTLLRSVAGIERISGGSITLGDSLVASGTFHAPPERRGLSMVFQDYALWPHLVVRDNVAFALRRRGLDRATTRREADQMLGRVGLAQLAERYPNELSGGEQQRVALARALIADTGIILCDEPLSNLDADLRERLRIEISGLVRAAGTTAVYITHDQSEAFALADMVGVLEAGRLVQLDLPEAVYHWPRTPFVARFTGLAGELSGRLVACDERSGHAVVETAVTAGAASLRARVASERAEASPGTVMIRPNAVEIVSVEDDRRHCSGIVADVAFRGRGYDHVIDLADGTRIAGVASDVRAERRSAVGVRFDAAGCLFFPDPATA